MNLSSLLSIGAAGVSLILSIWLLIYGFINKGQQDDWRKQQQELQGYQTTLGNLQQEAQGQQQQVQAAQQLADKVGPAVLKDIGGAALKPPNGNEKLKSLLARHKITVSTPAASPGEKPPAAAATPRP